MKERVSVRANEIIQTLMTFPPFRRMFKSLRSRRMKKPTLDCLDQMINYI